MAASERQRPVIASKLVPPPLPAHAVVRQRLDRLFVSLLSSRRVLWVCATAGAGKTTAVVHATATIDRPLAWLTLDDTDAAPGRLLTYLERALAGVDASVDGIVVDALGSGVAHAEAAGLLVDAVTRPALLVIDELDRLADSPPALAVIGALARHAGPELRLLLVSRRELPLDVGAQPSPTMAAAVTEAELAFTIEEAAVALARAGAEIDADAAVQATGGWVAGVLFEAWRSAEHVAGIGGEADPLHGYLGTQIVDRLEPRDRELLETCAVLDRVTAVRAARLVEGDAAACIAGLRAHHLPVTWEDDGRCFRFHPRFREYLLERLERRGARAVARVHGAHGRLLHEEGHHEEAVEALLRAGCADAACASMEHAIRAVVERLDFPVAERWLAAIDPRQRQRSVPLAAAELMLALGQDQYARGVAVGDALVADGRLEELVLSFERAATMLAWCAFHVGRTDDVARLHQLVAGTEEGELIHELLTLADRDDSRLAVRRRASDPFDGLVMRLHWSHGRLRELRQPPVSRWAAAVGGPWRVAALRATGQAGKALELLESIGDGRDRSGLLEIVGAEVFRDLGRAEEAWASLARGRAKIQMTGSAFLLLLSVLIEARLELRLSDDRGRARAALAAIERHPSGRSYRWMSEQVATLRGLLALLDGDDEQAAVILRGAVASMLAGARTLELPAAAVYLSEAEWRLDDEEAADRAADCALDAADRQGTNHLALQALAEFPAVAARRLDAEARRDSRWHAIARCLVDQGVGLPLAVAPRVELREFGCAAIVVDGSVCRPRIKKSHELLAYLVAARGEARTRDQQLDALFGGRADESARSYLRQAVRELRGVAPDVLEGDDSGTLRLASGAAFDSDSGRLDALLVEAARLQGEQRLERLRDALALVDSGDFLPGLSSPWVDARREELRSRINHVRGEAADLAYRHGRFAEADALLRRLLADDPLREQAWRLRIRLAHTLADDDAVIDAYRRCRDALGAIGLEPATATRSLVAELRA